MDAKDGIDGAPPPALPEMLAAFEAWCEHQRLYGRLRRGSSEAVYRAMWHALAAWCVGQTLPVRLQTLDGVSLLQFLASRSGIAGPGQSLTPRYQWRLLSLVRWVQAYQATQQPVARRKSGNAAAEVIATQAEVRHANAAHDDDVPACLSATDVATLLASLAVDGRVAGSQDAKDADADPPRWQTVRNRCAAGLQLGAGLGPGDVRALRLNDVLGVGGLPDLPSTTARPPMHLRVAANGSAPLHVVPIAPWAARALAHWLQLRAEQQLAGDWLFPSTRSGKPWGKIAQYGSVRQVLADAGLDPGAGGSFRLRHSFALRQLQAGHPPEAVSRWLGVIDPAVMARYDRLIDPATRAAWSDPDFTAPAAGHPV